MSVQGVKKTSQNALKIIKKLLIKMPLKVPENVKIL